MFTSNDLHIKSPFVKPSLILSCSVLVIVALLPGRIRRVAHDDADVEGLLAFAAVAVVGEEIADEIAFFVELEGVGEADALEGFVRVGRPYRAGNLCLTGAQGVARISANLKKSHIKK